LSLESLDAKYRARPVNLGTINDFANEYFFLSTLVCGGTVNVKEATLELARRFESNARLTKFLNESQRLVTPDGLWHYGLPWPRVKREYALGLVLRRRMIERAPSVFARRLWLQLLQKPSSLEGQ
jgi:hypothetical protein